MNEQELTSVTEKDPVRAYASLTFMRGALVSLMIAMAGGMLAVLYYIPSTVAVPRSMGIEFTALRPIHTTFISAWIFLGALSVVHHFFHEHAGRASKLEKALLTTQVLCWALAGGGILITLLMGITSGREYVGYHPIFSIPILVGWLCFTCNLMRVVGRGFFRFPIYVSMWGVGAFFFIFTFLEQHLWLNPGYFAEPVADLRAQWKACGTLVGSFNLFVYGCLIYVGERVSGDRNYARSRLAYALFAVGLLNSFTNFAHHTYHLPQGVGIKWISFVISMTEIIILVRVVMDISRLVNHRKGDAFHSTKFFLAATKWWTLAILFSSILISIPPLNTLIHGTHVVMGHAMGAEIGIDTMALFAAMSFLLAEIMAKRDVPPSCTHSGAIRACAIGFNVSAAALVGWLHLWGLLSGCARYLGQPAPDWIRDAGPYVFAGTGILTSIFLVALLSIWMRMAFQRCPAALPEPESAPSVG